MTGEEIKKLRTDLGWPQWKLAEYLGVEQGTVSRLEGGQWEPSGPVCRLLDHLKSAPPSQPGAAA